MSGMKSFHQNSYRAIAVLLLLVFFIAASGCPGPSDGGQGSQSSDQSSPPPQEPEITPLEYPFAEQNMFFGLSLINPRTAAGYVEELGVSWVSLQPHVIWFDVEREPGIYDWSYVDGEIKGLQKLGLDVTMVLSPVINAFGEERDIVIEAASEYPSLMAFLRESEIGKEMQLYPHDETIPLWIDFLKAAVDRYDGDGVNDMPGLEYAVRNWHFIEEWPAPSLDDEEIYVELLKLTYETIKDEDPQAKVILVGLAGNFLRYFAFMRGYIDDPEAGVYNSTIYTKAQLALTTFWGLEMLRYEYILEEAGDYFDVIDIHGYIIKESFMEGEIEYIQQTMAGFGYSKPIWIIEGGGPFKNYPGKKAENSPGDPYFGFGSEKENAEFVVKLHVMSAAMGVERQHWGLGPENKDGYWDGPWKGMSLIDPDEGYKKPSYYTFILLREKLDGFTEVQDISQGDIRIFSFAVGDRTVYVAWNAAGNDVIVDLSGILADGQARVTHIVTDLDSNRNPIYLEDEVANPNTILVGITPIFIETTD
jgi:hypothetical protein